MGKQQALEAIVEYLKGNTVALAPAVPPCWAISQLFLEILNTLEIDPATKVRVPACGYMPWGSGKPNTLSAPICGWVLEQLAAAIASQRQMLQGDPAAWVEGYIEQLAARLVIATYLERRGEERRAEHSGQEPSSEIYASSAVWYLWRIIINQRAMKVIAVPPGMVDALMRDERLRVARTRVPHKCPVIAFDNFVDNLLRRESMTAVLLPILDQGIDFMSYVGASAAHSRSSSLRSDTFRKMVAKVCKSLNARQHVRVLIAGAGVPLHELLLEDLRPHFDDDLSECRPPSQRKEAIRQVVELVEWIAKVARKETIRLALLTSAIRGSLGLSQQEVPMQEEVASRSDFEPKSHRRVIRKSMKDEGIDTKLRRNSRGRR